MPKFRKGDVIFETTEAIQLRRDNWPEVCKFAHVGFLEDGKPEGHNVGHEEWWLNIPTKEGIIQANENDWIIRGPDGELSVCELVEENVV